MKKIHFILFLILILSLVSVVFFLDIFDFTGNNTSNKLGLQDWYRSDIDPYSVILSNVSNPSVNSSEIDPYVKPQMGFKTNGLPAEHPLKIADEGLYLVISGNTPRAAERADWLMTHSVEKNGALFFPFTWCYEPVWPYNLTAPWNSGLTQAMSLGLFTYLYQSTKNETYLHTADKIFQSYKVDLNDGGFTRYDADGPFFEEYPTEVPTRVLNGEIMAMLALHDYAIISGNTDAMNLFNESCHELEILLPEYDMVDPKTGLIVSAYSIAPSRTTILGRFTGDGQIYVGTMKITGIKNGSTNVLESVDVAGENDEGASSAFSIWHDKDFMNWGQKEMLNKVSVRNINGNVGQFNHSPFIFALSSYDIKNYDELKIEITYFAKKGTGHLQFYDGEQYWPIGEISENSSQGFETRQYAIPDNFLNSWQNLTNSETRYPVDVKYLDDNQILVQILGNLTNSQTFQYYSERWKPSEILVPPQYLNRYPISPFQFPTSEPIIRIENNSLEDYHVEYPSVTRINSTWVMYYCAYGTDKRWKIMEAQSSNMKNWQKLGHEIVFEGYPLGNTSNIAFPYVIKLDNGTYVMYFSSSKTINTTYSTISYAISPDGYSWKYGGIAVDEGGLDPFIIRDKTGRFMLFYVIPKIQRNEIVLKNYVSTDGFHWENPKIILSGNQNQSFYTTGGILQGNTIILFLDSLRHARHALYVFKYLPNTDEILGLKDPIHITGQNYQWDSMMYGLDFVQSENTTYTFYNGISEVGAENGGQIGMAVLDQETLNNLINNSEEFKDAGTQ